MSYPSEIEKIQDQIVEYYNQGHSSSEVAKYFGISKASAVRHINLSGKKNRSFTRQKSKYSIDETFFEKIDTHQKAQILGMIYADGCLSRNGKTSVDAWRLQIGLIASDVKYLEQINSIMKNTAPIKIENYKKNDKEHWIVHITNKQPFSKMSTHNYKICHDIQKLGVSERKSTTCEFPSLDQVPDEFIPSFVLGYFEGDGGFYYIGQQASASFCCSKSFAEKLQKILLEKINITSRLSIMNGDERMLHLTVKGNQHILTLMEWMYKNSTSELILERKLKQYEDFKKNYFERKEFIKTEEFINQRKNKVFETTKIHGGKIRHNFYIKDSNGQIYYSNRLNKFYKKYNLNPSHASMLINKKRDEYIGWTRPTEEEIQNAKENNLIINEIFKKCSRREWNEKHKKKENSS